MEDKSKSRVTMLALSGVLLISTAFGWAVYNGKQAAKDEPVAAVPATSGQDGTSPLQTSQALGQDGTSPLQTSQIETPPTVGQAVYPSTSMDEAIRAARASITKNPTEPIGYKSRAVATQLSRSHHREPKIDVVPPPPNTSGLADPPSVYIPRQSDLYPMATDPVQKRSDKVGVDDVRLVGLIDGKAIFRVRRNVAEELAIPRNFTLGSGESFGEIKLDSVNHESATLHDGTKVATKVLESIH